MSLTLAITTFVGQNLGAKKQERVKQGAKIGIIMAVILAELIGLTFFAIAPKLIGLFSQSPEVIAFGVRQARVEALFYCMLAFSHAVAAVMRGSGRPIIPMGIMLGSWCLFRITYITIFVSKIQDIAVVFSAYPVTWTISSIIFAFFLAKGDWLKI